MNRLQERRLALGLSQPDVSAKLKEIDPRMDVGMVSRFERGACLPTPLVLEGLERILQASRSDLFGADELGGIHILEAPKEAPSPTTLMIQNAIPVGRRNAIKREALAKKLHMTDRKMREAIEQARSEGLIPRPVLKGGALSLRCSSSSHRKHWFSVGTLPFRFAAVAL